MRPRPAALLLALLALALLAGLAAACGGEKPTSAPAETTTETATAETAETRGTTTADETTTAEERKEPVVVSVRVRGGVPQGGIVRATVRRGERVVLRVRADVADEVHVHGYDLVREVAPGREARIAFRAAIPGRFEVELERRHVQIAELTVRP